MKYFILIGVLLILTAYGLQNLPNSLGGGKTAYASSTDPITVTPTASSTPTVTPTAAPTPIVTRTATPTRSYYTYTHRSSRATPTPNDKPVTISDLRDIKKGLSDRKYRGRTLIIEGEVERLTFWKIEAKNKQLNTYIECRFARDDDKFNPIGWKFNSDYTVLQDGDRTVQVGDTIQFESKDWKFFGSELHIQSCTVSKNSENQEPTQKTKTIHELTHKQRNREP